ncbi:MAG: hypothetical protein IT422_06755 [Pirellulaceae bacterium]|nr:hypothetical protein [Pirellulaceae bacterium]
MKQTIERLNSPEQAALAEHRWQPSVNTWRSCGLCARKMRDFLEIHKPLDLILPFRQHGHVSLDAANDSVAR